MISWQDLKEVFFTIGSIAGVLALSKPIFEKKMERDAERVNYVKSIISEQELIDFETEIWHSRRAPDSIFRKLARLRHEIDTNQDAVRFSGPTARYLKEELSAIVSANRKLITIIRIPEWDFVQENIQGDREWVFNKEEFRQPDGNMGAYDVHLEEASKVASELVSRFQRFQVVSELHLYEVPIASWLLRRRFKKLRR